MSAKFHDALDRFEARCRAEAEEAEIDRQDTERKENDRIAAEIAKANAFAAQPDYIAWDNEQTRLAEQDDILFDCACFTYCGDNPECPVHGRQA